MPTISVVMSIYKEPVEWMRRAIESILDQTYRDFEFIIVNDKPDREENTKLLNEFTQIDSRIKVIINEQNIGLTKSLNKGISIAQGEFIARMDADDISLPRRFEKQIAYMKSNPDIIASGTGSFIIDEKGHVCEKINALTDPMSIRTTLIFKTAITHPSAIIRKEFDGICFKYDEHFKLAQDYALWGFLIRYPLGNIREPLIKYRISTQQISSSKKIEQDLYAMEIKQEIIKKLELPFSLDQISRFMNICESTIENIQISQLFITGMIDSLHRTHDNNLWSSEIMRNYILSNYYYALRKSLSIAKSFSYIRAISSVNLSFILYKLIVGFEIKRIVIDFSIFKSVR